MAASSGATRRIMKELVHSARNANKDGVPRHARADVTLDGHFMRLSAHSTLIEKRGGFEKEAATLALVNRSWETKEPFALWLSQELQLLREGHARVGAAPVRTGKALSRIEIADLAITMLECLVVGDNLLCLFQELLNVDRHRQDLATSDRNMKSAAEIEAQFNLQGHPCGVQQLARLVSVRPSSVTRWRRSDKYRKAVADQQRVLSEVVRDKYFEQIERDHGPLTDVESFRHAFRMWADSLPDQPGLDGQPPRPEE
jgi:hypothetical protein